MLESRNSIPFFKYFPIEMAKLKPREILSRLDVGWNILWSVWYNLTSEQSAILQLCA